MNRRRIWAVRGLLWLLMLLPALMLRLTIVHAPRVATGDGLQYHQLAQILKTEHRFAYLPAPSPLTYTRLPGYPLFLALTQPNQALPMEEHLVSATRANALLDVGTAAVVAALASQLGLGLFCQLFGFWAVILMPTMFMLSTVGLCESLVTFLLTMATYLAVRTRGSDPSIRWLWVALAGLFLGLAQLVRVDSLLTIPAVLAVLGLTAASWRERWQSWVLCLGVAALCFAPWPLRNLRLFRAAHAGGSPWIDMAGQPLPMGMMRWYQTWATGRIDGEGFHLMMVARHAPLSPYRPNIIMPAMYENEAERRVLVRLFEQYSREGLSPAVDRMFYRLAARRLAERPLRVLVTLPLIRLGTLWSPMPPYELSIHSKLLGLPQLLPLWNGFGSLLLLLSVAGACVACFESDKRRWVLALLLVPLVRSVGFVYLHPIPLQRYFVEAMPVLLLFSGYALSRLLRLWDGPPRSHPKA